MTMDDMEGIEDAAILLMSLGEEEAAEVFKHLAPKRCSAWARPSPLKTIRARARRRRARQVHALAGEQSMLVTDTDEYVKSVLRKALGEDKANLLIDRILQGSRRHRHREPEVDGRRLGGRAAAQRAPADRGRHPGAPRPRPGRLGAQDFTERQRNEVMVRIATLDGIQPTALKDPTR